jgi:hypothetical protein
VRDLGIIAAVLGILYCAVDIIEHAWWRVWRADLARLLLRRRRQDEEQP